MTEHCPGCTCWLWAAFIDRLIELDVEDDLEGDWMEWLVTAKPNPQPHPKPEPTPPPPPPPDNRGER